MLIYHNLINKLNKKVKTSYEIEIQKIKTIWEEDRNSEDKFRQFAFANADKLFSYSELEKEFSGNYYKEKSLDNLKATNSLLFNELKVENYKLFYESQLHI